ncbi:MAG: nucleotidyltransferase [Lachnospiraceae bacterium]|nr:nucleotidyltransferase [Lachnospiraceae bacterium]
MSCGQTEIESAAGCGSVKKAPALVIMAAGMGSRYGGLKQIDPVDAFGHILMDFSIYDAAKAGFGEVVFVIRKENEEIFREAVGNRVEKKMKVHYVFQDITDLPDGFSVPEGRVKPWGTGHAVLAARNVISGPFAVINADDFYGREAFQILYDYLTTHEDDEKYRYVMAGYVLGNTLTENGSVSRGVCAVDEEGYLTDIHERKKIVRTKDDAGAAYTEDDGSTWTPLPETSAVSLNVWGFTPSFLEELKARFPAFLEGALKTDPLKGEFFLPSVVDALIKEGKAAAAVKMTPDKWYGITYKEDKPMVEQAIRAMEEAGIYPEDF